MTSPHTNSYGRHRGSSARPTALLSDMWRRPNHKSALKGLGLAASALGVATAFAAPAPAPEFQLTAATTQAPIAARAKAVSAPEQVTSYGVIGFKAQAQALPKPKPTPTPTPEPEAAAATPERTPDRASRGANYSRAGLGPLSGMSENAVAVVNEVHASFPEISDIGGYRAGDPGDHGSGHAVDIMCSGSTGDAVAAHLQGMAGTLGIKYIIWKQRIWYPGGGWESMSDRGSATANHYDHVHVSVN